MTDELARTIDTIHIFEKIGKKKITLNALTDETVKTLEKIGYTVKKQKLFKQYFHEIYLGKPIKVVIDEPVLNKNTSTSNESADCNRPFKWKKGPRKVSEPFLYLDSAELDIIKIEADIRDCINLNNILD